MTDHQLFRIDGDALTLWFRRGGSSVRHVPHAAAATYALAVPPPAVTSGRRRSQRYAPLLLPEDGGDHAEWTELAHLRMQATIRRGDPEPLETAIGLVQADQQSHDTPVAWLLPYERS